MGNHIAIYARYPGTAEGGNDFKEVIDQALWNMPGSQLDIPDVSVIRDDTRGTIQLLVPSSGVADATITGLRQAGWDVQVPNELSRNYYPPEQVGPDAVGQEPEHTPIKEPPTQGKGRTVHAVA